MKSAVLSGLAKFVVDADSEARLAALGAAEAMARAQGAASEALVEAGYPRLLCERCAGEKDRRCLRLVLGAVGGCAQAAEGAGAKAVLEGGGVDSVLGLLAARGPGEAGTDASIVEAGARALVGVAVLAEGKAALVKAGGCRVIAGQLGAWAEAAAGGGGGEWMGAVRALGQLCSLASLAAVDDDAKRGLQEAGAVGALVGGCDPAALLRGVEGATGAGDAPIAGSEFARKSAAEAPAAEARAACLAAAQASRALSAVCALPAGREEALGLNGQEAVARAVAFAKDGAGGGGGAAGVLLRRAAEGAYRVLTWKP